MDPKKVSAEWWRGKVFTDEAIRPRPSRNDKNLPSLLCAARSLENGVYQSWQSREVVFLKQAKLLENYEDDYDSGSSGGIAPYLPTYQGLSNEQLRDYFFWRTRLRHGDVRETRPPFIFIYCYELLNQIGVSDPIDGYRRLKDFHDAYGRLDGYNLSLLERWMADYVVYYGLDPILLAGTPQAAFDRDIAVLDNVQDREPDEIIPAVKRFSPNWLERSKFYRLHQEDMEEVIARVLRRVSRHYAARCKKSMVEQYFGGCTRRQTHLFDSAVFCDPLKRRDYEYTVNQYRVYYRINGTWYLWARDIPSTSNKKLGALLKTIDSVMRQEYGFPSPVKGEMDTKWALRLIREEVRLFLEEKTAGEKKIAIDFTQLTQIRRDAAITQDRLSVEEDADMPEEPSPPEAEPAPPLPPEADGPAGAPALDPAEYRFLRCLLYGGDTGWMRSEGVLPSVLADGINEKFYDLFQDCVLDDASRPVEDYVDDLKEMVRL